MLILMVSILLYLDRWLFENLGMWVNYYKILSLYLQFQFSQQILNTLKYYKFVDLS